MGAPPSYCYGRIRKLLHHTCDGAIYESIVLNKIPLAIGAIRRMALGQNDRHAYALMASAETMKTQHVKGKKECQIATYP